LVHVSFPIVFDIASDIHHKIQHIDIGANAKICQTQAFLTHQCDDMLYILALEQEYQHVSFATSVIS